MVHASGAVRIQRQSVRRCVFRSSQKAIVALLYRHEHQTHRKDVCPPMRPIGAAFYFPLRARLRSFGNGVVLFCSTDGMVVWRILHMAGSDGFCGGVRFRISALVGSDSGRFGKTELLNYG